VTVAVMLDIDDGNQHVFLSPSTHSHNVTASPFIIACNSFQSRNILRCCSLACGWYCCHS